MDGFRDPALRQTLHRHEAEDFDSADAGARSPGDDLSTKPTLGLDIMTARTITTFIRECRDRGKTVIFSTHIMSEVEKLCDVIGIIHDGKLLTEGTLAAVAREIWEQDLEEIFREDCYSIAGQG